MLVPISSGKKMMCGPLREIWLLLLICVSIAITCSSRDRAFLFPGTDIWLRLHRSVDFSVQQYSIVKGDQTIQTVSLDNAFFDATAKSSSGIFTLTGNDQITDFELLAHENDQAIIQVTRNLRKGQSSQDCFYMSIGRMNWYGGPENRYQYWPVEKSHFSDYAYVSKEKDNCAITERYWLNSNGVFVYVEEDVPLFINQNGKGFENQLCFKAAKILPYNTENSSFRMQYKIGVALNAREAHLLAINKVLLKPNQFPDEIMVRYPIWSTWALYKTKIDDSTVRDFASKITANGFKNSQLEIDDNWEECYGSLTFDKMKFPDVRKLTDDLKQQGFRITLWIHPFINKNCEKWYNEAKQKNYLVVNREGNPDTQWWNSDKGGAAYIDFTNKEAAQWFSDRLKELQKQGIDSFKFDAGESSWSPEDPTLNGPKNLQPSLITSDYIRTVANFGSIVEVRSGQKTQDLNVFVRMIDKDSEWGWNNGLITLITTLFQLNFAGYNFVLPDMIGGNGYDNHPPNKEMFIRWLEANVFMPSLQFSYVPWNFDQETIEICKTYTKLHEDVTDYILERFKLVTRTGEPVNPPIWWLDTEDIVARQIYDEFLLGDKYLSAPVVTQNQEERDIYLPKGKWKDGNNGEMHTGPKWLMNYKAPLQILPYFIKEE